MKVRIDYTYKTPKGLETTFTSEEMEAEKAVLLYEDLERTGRMKHGQFIDSKESTWTLKELKKFLEGIQTEPHNVTIYFDGGFDQEACRSGLGCVIFYEQNRKKYRLRRNALVGELNSNNEAEYAALHLALKELEVLGVHHLSIKIKGDSQVVINQLKGEWPSVEPELNRWADRIDEKLKQLNLETHYEHVSRKSNREADQLATQALKDIDITSTIELV